MEEILNETPPEIADLIKDVIQDKVVCDIGCGNGNFMQAMSKYAKKVIGIEEIEARYQEASSKGFDVVFSNSFFDRLPQADVYYSWTRDTVGQYLKAKAEGKKGIFIFGISGRPFFTEFIKTVPNAQVRRDRKRNWFVFVCKLD